MNLPDDSIGISDIIAHRECPRRMSYGMKRHIGRGQQDDSRAPEGRAYATSYGSAVHDLIQAVEDGYGDEDAIQKAWNKWGAQLEPPDIDRLRRDLAVYRTRDFPQTRTIASEDEFRVPLFEHAGRTIYFRFKVDRLYERLDAPGVFIHVDYKSSTHPKSEREIHEDKQLWAYNFGIHEVFPECDTLLQFYDQLNFGQVQTRKSADQRRQMREFLIVEATKILEDEDWQADDLLRPTYNKWCPWCPLLESCPVVDELSDFALTRIRALAPPTKNGRRVILDLDEQKLHEYAGELGKAVDAQRVLERYGDAVKDLLRHLPDGEREKLGWQLRARTNSTFTPRAKAAMLETLGPERFLEVASVTKTRLESALGDDPDLLAWALELADKTDGAPSIVRGGSG